MDFSKNIQKHFPEQVQQIGSLYIQFALNKISSQFSDFQQRYDWFDAFFMAMNEWLDFVQSNHSKCVHDNQSFVRHVHAGSFDGINNNPQTFRHYF